MSEQAKDKKAVKSEEKAMDAALKVKADKKKIADDKVASTTEAHKANKENKETLVYAAKANARFGELVAKDGDVTITIKRKKFGYKGDMLDCVEKLVQAVREDRGNE